MEVFVSWSGKRSGAAATALRDWLPKVINALRPWISSDDVDKGTRWSAEIASKLKNVKAGIICLTPSNLHNDWILFEAGAISKSVENTFVCPLLIDLQPNEISGPLTQFQATRATKEDLLKLLKTLNQALGEDALEKGHVEEAFETWWPKLESKLAALPAEQVTSRTQRSEGEIMDELLELTRGLTRQQSSLINSLTYLELKESRSSEQFGRPRWVTQSPVRTLSVRPV